MPIGGGSARHYAIAWGLALGCWAGCALLQILLYLRPSPYGGAFLLEWRKYFALALYYDLLGVWLIALPFLLFWLLRWRKETSRRRAATVHALQGATMALYLALSAFDHELLRFLGIRLGFSFLLTYLRPETLSDSLFLDVLADDPGGPFLPLILVVLAPLLYAWWARQLVRRRAAGDYRPRAGLWLAIAILVVPIAAPANGWRMATGKFRLRKIEPVVIALASDAALGFGDLKRPRDFARLASEWQSDWLAASADKGWAFPDPERPYLRVPTAPAPPDAAAGKRWNIIYLQLETFRGGDMGYLGPPGRPSATGAAENGLRHAPGMPPERPSSATPYLDSLTARPDASVWTRAMSFGPPSVNGLFAVHCSLAPHSERYLSSLTNIEIDCLPEALRRRGYRTEMFNAGDTDWDNSTFWLSRWYDRLWRYPEARERDRPVFRAAARRIRQLAASGRPFLASLVSVTNHTPFRSREAGFAAPPGASAEERIRATTRYTDDVVREFLESLRGEPWFANTLVVIAGDHGFNLGEHDGRPGQKNLYRESVWVPLIVLGAHPRLPRGRIDSPASLLDVAPTLADLIGLREANSWQGRSLAAGAGAGPSGPSLLGFKTYGLLAAETGLWSAVTDPRGGRTLLFDSRRDWAQTKNLAAARPRLAEALLARATDRVRLSDYVLRRDLVWRAPAPAPAAGRNAPPARPPGATGRSAARPGPAPPGP